MEVARESDGTVTAGEYILPIPKVLLLPYFEDTTELYQEHGFTILIAMLGRVLMRPMQGQNVGVFSKEQFWDAVSERILRLVRIWELYQQASQADSEERSKEIANMAYQAFVKFIFELLGTPKANKNIDRTLFESFCHGVCLEINRFYQSQEERAKKSRSWHDRERAERFAKETHYEYFR